MRGNSRFRMVGLHVDFNITPEYKCDSDHSKNLQIFESQIIVEKSEYESDVLESTSHHSTSSLENYKTYKCLICHKTFCQKSIYHNHLRSHGEDEDAYCCNICGKSFSVPARLSRHYRTHTGEKPYRCEYCNKSFSVKENLSVHRRIHTKERPYKCGICGSAFEHSGKLHRHMRIHTGERPHKCTLCSKTFIQSGQLVIHMRTHTGEKPYICQSCDKGFTCSKQLKVHTRTHTGEKPYKCEICGKSFGYNHVLKLHQVAHYGEKFYKCTLCEETFNTKKLMELHVKLHSIPSIDGPSKIDESNIDTMNNMNNITFISNNQVTKDQTYSITADMEEQTDTEMNELIKREDVSSTLEITSCDNLHKKHRIINEICNLQIKQSNSLATSNPIISSYVNTSNAELQMLENNMVENRITLHKRLSTEINEEESYGCERYEDKFISKECKSVQTNDNQFTPRSSGLFKKRLDKYQEESEYHKNLYSSYFRESSLLYTNPLDIVLTNTEESSSLPLRKRCRMILESMEIKNPDLFRATRYSSVIRFAKAKNT